MTILSLSTTFSSLYPEIQRNLSVIGKRVFSKEGFNEFSQITVSSAEREMFNLYMQSAAQQAVASIEPFVSNYNETSTAVGFNIVNSRWNNTPAPDFINAVKPALDKYLVFYTIAEFLSMNYPELAKKYHDLAHVKLMAFVRLIYFKAPPTADSYDFSDVDGEVVEPNDNTTT